MPTPEDALQRARSAYDAAADHYDAAPLSFWDHFGRKTVERLHLRNGERVLDAACGSGASAIPAAAAVGPQGFVVGVDLSERLLELAKSKATRAGLQNIEFKLGDMLALSAADSSFDAVLCVFGIFFVPDMVGAARELWRLVRPGGKLAITTWGPDLFEPANSVFWNAIARVRPDLHKAFNPWDRISSPGSLRQMLEQAGIAFPEVESENKLHPIASAEDWWTIVRGTGYRGTIEQLSATDYDTVRQMNFAELANREYYEVETNVLFAVATKPDD